MSQTRRGARTPEIRSISVDGCRFRLAARFQPCSVGRLTRGLLCSARAGACAPCRVSSAKLVPAPAKSFQVTSWSVYAQVLFTSFAGPLASPASSGIERVLSRHSDTAERSSDTTVGNARRSYAALPSNRRQLDPAIATVPLRSVVSERLVGLGILGGSTRMSVRSTAKPRSPSPIARQARASDIVLDRAELPRKSTQR